MLKGFQERIVFYNWPAYYNSLAQDDEDDSIVVRMTKTTLSAASITPPRWTLNLSYYLSASLVRRSPSPRKMSASPCRTPPSRGESPDRHSHESPRKRSRSHREPARSRSPLQQNFEANGLYNGQVASFE
ncbi:hypothetical protein MKW98_031848 [Papaver atlanticum]|uniref:Uncharacterized protein n=1 Tax=Papaver atlanticum TaxID=357466 RepID=A0AAD4XCX2_9MAGN|nr:hypothetical protein MKW98_031848 [Papaver atlanticum]